MTEVTLVKGRNTKLAKAGKAAKSHTHAWRPWEFARKTGIQNPDKTGLLVHCQDKKCDAIELVAPQSVPVFFAMLKNGVEPVLVTPRNKLTRRAGVRRAKELREQREIRDGLRQWIREKEHS